MNDILLATIPAALVLVATLGARFLEHYLQSKRETERQKLEKERETRDARRKQRETLVTPLREQLTKLKTIMESRSLTDYLSKAVKDKGISFKPETVKGIEMLREESQRDESRYKWEVVTELIPLTAAITDKDVRDYVQKACFYFAVGKDMREEMNITDEDMNDAFDMAYLKLEEFVTLAH